MTPFQAIIKVRDDLISWCTNNFKKKADVSTVTQIEARLDTLSFPTIQEQCASQNIILSSKQYGTTTPENPVNGQLFFLKVE